MIKSQASEKPFTKVQQSLPLSDKVDSKCIVKTLYSVLELAVKAVG